MRAPRNKILFIASWYPSRINPLSGLYIKKHAEAIARYCDVLVVYVSDDENLTNITIDVGYINENGVPTIRGFYRVNDLKLPLVSKLIKAVRYFRTVRQTLVLAGNLGFKNPDLVHLNVVTVRAGLLTLSLKVFKGINYVVTEHWSMFTKVKGTYVRLPYILKLIIRKVYANAAGVSAVSNYLLRDLKYYNLLNANNFVIPNVVGVADSLSLRIKQDSPFKFLSISLLNDKVKNISGIINATRKLIETGKDVELHIVGDGPDRQKLEDLARECQLLNTKVFFHGYIPNQELPKCFAWANAFVLNSNFETFSVATLEAIACGVPVIVTKCGGPEEFVNEAVGVLVDKTDQKSLASGMEWMVENGPRFQPEALRSYVNERFGTETVGKQFLNLYNSVRVR